MSLDTELLEILVCPKCKQALHYFEDEEVLFCEECSLKYRVEDGIPIMLVDEAEKADKAEKQRLLKKASK